MWQPKLVWWTTFNGQKWSLGPVWVARFGAARTTIGKGEPFLATRSGPGEPFLATRSGPGEPFLATRSGPGKHEKSS